MAFDPLFKVGHELIRFREAHRPQGLVASAATPAQAWEGTGMAENFTAEERAAMKERAQEVRKSRGKTKKDEEPAVLEKIAELSGTDRELAERVHAIVKEAVPELLPRL